MLEGHGELTMPNQHSVNTTNCTFTITLAYWMSFDRLAALTRLDKPVKSTICSGEDDDETDGTIRSYSDADAATTLP